MTTHDHTHVDAHGHVHAHGSDSRPAFIGLIVGGLLLGGILYGTVLLTNHKFAGEHEGAKQEAPAAKH